MNVALTYFCNQDCAYCFGRDAMSLSKAKATREISMASLKLVMAFMQRSGVSKFNMIGGEPTLHSRFEEIYDAVRKHGFSVDIFSNGVIFPERVEYLKNQDNLVSVLLNVREPAEYAPQDWEKILHTCSALQQKITLSFRIYKLDFDPRFMFDLIDRYALRRVINWAIACPSLVRDNRCLSLEDHGAAVGRMVDFSRESRQRNIRWYSDSGFISCAFSGGRAAALAENVGFTPLTNCYPPVEVAPDLRVFRCYGVAAKTRKGLKITDFVDLAEAERYFFTRSLALKRMGGMDKCFSCEYIVTRECAGGCLVHSIKKIPGYATLPEFF